MLELLSRFFGRENPSASIAKERLRLVLVHDRASTSPQFLEMLKEELIQVISKYLEIELKDVEVNLSQEGGSTALVANIPVRQVKRGANAR